MSDTKTITYTSGMSNSLREELSDVITNIAPTDTPFISTIRKGKVKSTKPEWLEDTLDAAAANAVLEGADTVADAIVVPTRVYNYTQILEKSFMISGTLEVTDKAGRKSEISYQTGLKTKALARDVEYNALNQTQAVGGAATARAMKGAYAFVTTNTYAFGSAYAAGNHITEELLNDQLQACWEAGGDPDTVLAPPAQKRKISAFTDDGRLHVHTSADAKKVIMTVRVMETDFGTVVIIPSRHSGEDNDGGTYYQRLLIYEKAKWELAYLRPLKRVKLAKTGDHEKFLINVECTLKALAQTANGKITYLSKVGV
jgi:hypothetical protein